jgi:hypothetical protein
METLEDPDFSSYIDFTSPVKQQRDTNEFDLKYHNRNPSSVPMNYLAQQ